MPEMEGLSLKSAYAFGSNCGHQGEVEEIRNMVIEWDMSYTSTLRRGYIVDLFERSGLFTRFKKEYWPFGNTPAGDRKRLRYLRVKKQYEDFLAGKGSEPDAASDGDEEDVDEQRFAAEADLRDFLAQNTECVEKGLRLYKDGEKLGVEYPVDSGFIDLLAIDSNKKFVVIELKLGRGRNKALGQILYYMGWIDANFSDEAPCRGMIIAKEIPEELIIAAQRVPGVSLLKYNLSVSVELVATKV